MVNFFLKKKQINIYKNFSYLPIFDRKIFINILN